MTRERHLSKTSTRDNMQCQSGGIALPLTVLLQEHTQPVIYPHPSQAYTRGGKKPGGGGGGGIMLKLFCHSKPNSNANMSTPIAPHSRTLVRATANSHGVHGACRLRASRH